MHDDITGELLHEYEWEFRDWYEVRKRSDGYHLDPDTGICTCSYDCCLEFIDGITEPYKCVCPDCTGKHDFTGGCAGIICDKVVENESSRTND